MEGWDPNTKSTLTQIPLLTTKAGPRNGAAWTQRLKEEYKALIAYTSMNKSKDNDWFRISPLSVVARLAGRHFSSRRSPAPSPRRRSLSPVIYFSCFISLRNCLVAVNCILDLR